MKTVCTCFLSFVNTSRSVFRKGYHQKAVASGFFVSINSNPQGGLANGPCLGCTHKEMRLLTSQRVNLLEVSQEQGKLGDGRLADVNSALEIESRPYGCSSLRMAESWVSPFLACPIV